MFDPSKTVETVELYHSSGLPKGKPHYLGKLVKLSELLRTVEF